MNKYTLYLDESETYDKHNNKYFVIGGVILDNEHHNNIIVKRINDIKKAIWINDVDCYSHILHEKDINFANNPYNKNKLDKVEECYHIFVSDDITTKLYNKLASVFTDRNITTIGVCLNKSELWNHYDEAKLNHQLSIAIQLLIENYCHFLGLNKSIGDICYEDIEDNQNIKIQQRLYEMKALGTMYYSPHAIQSYIKNIYFPNKRENVAGLQLADFIPNTLARSACMISAKNNGITKNIKRRLYDGNIQKPDKYGFKIVP